MLFRSASAHIIRLVATTPIPTQIYTPLQSLLEPRACMEIGDGTCEVEDEEEGPIDDASPWLGGAMHGRILLCFGNVCLKFFCDTLIAKETSAWDRGPGLLELFIQRMKILNGKIGWTKFLST